MGSNPTPDNLFFVYIQLFFFFFGGGGGRGGVRDGGSEATASVWLKGNCHELTCALVLTVSGAGRHYGFVGKWELFASICI